jgi:uncharacterized DUF497 family protein
LRLRRAVRAAPGPLNADVKPLKIGSVTRHLLSLSRYANYMHIDIEWDSDEADSNLQKHGVSFEEAATAQLDPMALAQEDAASEGEPRWVLIGMSAQMRLVTVIYALRHRDRVRLISARKATRKVVKYYA